MDAIDSSWGILILCGELDFTVHEVIQGHFLYLYMFFWQMVTLFGLWQFMAHHITKQIIGENLMTWLGLGGENWVIGGEFNVSRWSWEISHDRTISSSMHTFDPWISGY